MMMEAINECRKRLGGFGYHGQIVFHMNHGVVARVELRQMMSPTEMEVKVDRTGEVSAKRSTGKIASL